MTPETKGAVVSYINHERKDMTQEPKSRVSIGYTNDTRRSGMLNYMNEVINSPELLSGGKRRISSGDKEAWRKIFNDPKYLVEWRNVANDRPTWKKITTTFPFRTIQTTIEFRVRPGSIDYREFREKYQITRDII